MVEAQLRHPNLMSILDQAVAVIGDDLNTVTPLHLRPPAPQLSPETQLTSSLPNAQTSAGGHRLHRRSAVISKRNVPVADPASLQCSLATASPKRSAASLSWTPPKRTREADAVTLTTEEVLVLAAVLFDEIVAGQVCAKKDELVDLKRKTLKRIMIDEVSMALRNSSDVSIDHDYVADLFSRSYSIIRAVVF